MTKELTIQLPDDYYFTLSREAAASGLTMDEMVQELISAHFVIGDETILNVTVGGDRKIVHLPTRTVQKAQEIIAEGQIIPAIKLIRADGALGLRDAKAVSDLLKDEIRRGIVR